MTAGTKPATLALLPAGSGSDEEPLLFDHWRPTADWVRVHIRRLRERDIPAETVRSGDYHRGAVMLMLQCGPDQWRLLHQIIAMDGVARWAPAHASAITSSHEAERRIHELTECDPDLWVVKIDLRTSMHVD